MLTLIKDGEYLNYNKQLFTGVEVHICRSH